MLKRKIYSELLKWKNQSNGTSAAMIEGARRTGKSFIAELFAKQEYQSFILIDFSKAPKQVKDWFDLYMEDIDTLLFYIQLHYQVKLVERSSVIIFDEVQTVPKHGRASNTLLKTVVLTILKQVRSSASDGMSRTY